MNDIDGWGIVPGTIVIVDEFVYIFTTNGQDTAFRYIRVPTWDNLYNELINTMTMKRHPRIGAPSWANFARKIWIEWQ